MKSPILILIALFLMVDVFWSSRLDLALAIENKSRVISPYWQSDSGSYSFIAVSHSSLSSIATQVGVVINAIQSDLTAFGPLILSTGIFESSRWQRIRLQLSAPIMDAETSPCLISGERWLLKPIQPDLPWSLSVTCRTVLQLPAWTIPPPWLESINFNLDH